jgi:hypothetical protein
MVRTAAYLSVGQIYLMDKLEPGGGICVLVPGVSALEPDRSRTR